MIIVQGHIRVAADKFALYRRRISQHAALVAAMDGCLQYSIAEDTEEAGLLWIGERWRDKAAQALHMGSGHMAEFNNFMKHLSMKSADIAVFETVDDGKWLMRIDGK